MKRGSNDCLADGGVGWRGGGGSGAREVEGVGTQDRGRQDSVGWTNTKTWIAETFSNTFTAHFFPHFFFGL